MEYEMKWEISNIMSLILMYSTLHLCPNRKWNYRRPYSQPIRSDMYKSLMVF